MDPLEAKAFFVDRVWDAVVAVKDVGATDHFKLIEPPSSFDSWIKFEARIIEDRDAKLVERAFKSAVLALQEYEK